MYKLGNNILKTVNGVILSPFKTKLPIISGLAAHYSDAVNNMYDKTKLPNDTIVTQWDDISGNGEHLTKIIDDKIIDAVISDGDILFPYSNDGSGKHAGFSGETSFSGSENRTVFTVVWSEDPTADTYVYYYTEAPIGSSSISGSWYTHWSDRLANYLAAVLFTTTTAAETWYTLTSKLDGTTVGDETVRMNGVDNTGSYLNSTTTISDDTNIRSVGGVQYSNNSTVINTSDVKMREIIIYNRALSTTEIGQVEDYLNQKYSIY